MGTAIASSASASRSVGRPQASLPNSHAVGRRSPSAASSSSSSRLAPPSAARTRRPASRSARAASPSGEPTTTGRWNRLPADARTHLPLYGSTDASENTTASAPAASAVRSTVPALPGSRTLASRTTSRGVPSEKIFSSGTSTNRHTASRPWGVTVWASSAITSPLTVCTAAPSAAASSAISSYRDPPAAVTNSSVTTRPGRAMASRTACGPSARNSRVRCRAERRASCRAALTRADRMLVISLPTIKPGTRLSGGFRLVDVRRQRLPGHVNQRGERGRLGYGQLGKHPAVDVHARDLQALDEPVVGHAVRPCRGVDALDPQPAECALAVLAVAVGVRHRVERLLLGLAVQTGPLTAVATGPLEDDPALLVGVNRPLHACHC